MYDNWQPDENEVVQLADLLSHAATKPTLEVNQQLTAALDNLRQRDGR